MNATELREFDAWIAKHVMGWKLQERNVPYYWKIPKTNRIYFLATGRRPDDTEWSPTIQPSAAMEVLKKCLTSGNYFTVALDEDDYKIEARHITGKTILVSATTLELAICLFAKKIFTK